VKRRGPNRTY